MFPRESRPDRKTCLKGRIGLTLFLQLGLKFLRVKKTRRRKRLHPKHPRKPPFRASSQPKLKTKGRQCGFE